MTEIYEDQDYQADTELPLHRRPNIRDNNCKSKAKKKFHQVWQLVKNDHSPLTQKEVALLTYSWATADRL